MSYERANVFQRLLRRFAASGPGSWLFVHVMHHIDGTVFRLSRGRFTLGSLIAGLPVAMLTTTGAKSGAPRTVPVLGLPTPDGLAVIASSWGQERHPAWYYNLRANPQGQLAVDGATRSFRAVEATGEQRERIWAEALKVYPGYSQYERRASHRKIAVFVLENA